MQKFSQTPDFNWLADLFAPPPQLRFPSNGFDFGSLLGPSFRRRSEWNDRISYWERSESTSETLRIERARDMVQKALRSNAWLISQGVVLQPQGSFTNRTNVRNDADIDLRVQHPRIVHLYEDDTARTVADIVDAWFPPKSTTVELATRMRNEVSTTLRKTFGSAQVDSSGMKAIRVRGVEGSRGEVDVVPSFCFQYHPQSNHSRPGQVIEGSALLAPNGEWSLNFSDRHIANGRWKRVCTSYQFKRVVRSVKRLQMEMLECGVITQCIPSFVIECLVYLVEDSVFLNATDRYGRIRSVLGRILELLTVGGVLSPCAFREINGVKFLFGPWQKYTPDQAIRFVRVGLDHLGDC